MYSDHDTLAGGFPHSDIHGSTPARGSPWLFAACHVLHRLLVPRHPPNALLILDTVIRTPKGLTSRSVSTMHGNHRQIRPRCRQFSLPPTQPIADDPVISFQHKIFTQR